MAEVLLSAIEPFDRSTPLACDEQLEEFSVCPQQWHCSTRGPAGQEPELGNRRRIPHLLRQQSAGARTAPHCLQIRQWILAALQSEMSPLADEQRPGTADAVPIESRSIGVLAIAIAVIATVLPLQYGSPLGK